MICQPFNQSRPDKEAAARERALDAAREAIRSARSRALLATCRWIVAEGTDDEVDARKAMDQADHDLNAARESSASGFVADR